MPPTRPAIPPGRTGRRGCSAHRSWAGVYQIGGMLAEPERGGQAGTFDAEHVDQTGDAMDLGALDDEIIGLAALFRARRSEEPPSELQSLMRISYAVFCLKQKTITSIMTHQQ